MKIEISKTFKVIIGIALPIITLLGFFGITKFTDFFGNKKDKETILLEEYFHQTKWIGHWTDKTYSSEYEAEMNLSVGNRGEIDGTIIWTLSKTNIASLEGQIGMQAIETITGDFVFLNSKLSITGISKIDPDSIIELSKYNLKLSENKKTLTGLDALQVGKTFFEKQ
jgi:hypothetical protein